MHPKPCIVNKISQYQKAKYYVFSNLTMWYLMQNAKQYLGMKWISLRLFILEIVIDAKFKANIKIKDLLTQYPLEDCNKSPYIVYPIAPIFKYCNNLTFYSFVLHFIYLKFSATSVCSRMYQQAIS